MGTYLIPRDLKGEGRILSIFSYKALAYTIVGLIIGYVFYFIFNLINLKIIGLVILAVLALVGFLIGTLKMPSTKSFEITRKTGGEKIDEVLLRYIKFKMKKNRIYVYTKDKEEGNE